MAFMGINFHKTWIFRVVLGCLHRDISIIWCLRSVGWNNYPGCALRALGLLVTVLLADSAHTVGRGKIFCRVRWFPSQKTVVTQKRNAKKSVRRCQNDRNAEGYKCPFDNSRGPIAKNGILGQNWCEQSIFALLLHRLKSKIFFHLTLLRHQSIKMSPCKHPKTTPKI